MPRKLLLLTTLLTLLSAPVYAKAPLKVGFVYHGPIQQSGWGFSHDQARKYVQAQLGDQVETSFVENVNENSDAERVINKMARSGNKLIFTTSFGFMNPTIKSAKRFKKVKFESVTGYKRTANVSNIQSRGYQGRYLTGLIAGKMTKSNIIGYVATFPIPEVIRGINAFVKGVKETNPEAEVKIIWISTWYDPAKEREASETLISQGTDILSTHTNSPTIVQTAEEKGIYAFGFHSNMAQYGPHAHLTSVIHNWNELYLSRVKAVIDGTWKSENIWYGLPQGVTDISPMNSVIPDDVQAMVNTAKQAIIDGNKHVFDGPLYNQDGDLMVAEGQTLEDKELATMNWYIAGIKSKLPGQ
jgi:basic membrane protein A